ncbi:MAG: hypothetical protein M1814_002947 [Vezdaea aestivalis]|nr:MAG: hypothetical protein M1814_002947 [Vezdaea aestivalis]
MAPLRIGYVPEHYLTPLHLAQKHYNLNAELVPFPSGTGHMITSLRSGSLDLAIGLTEGWIAGLGNAIRAAPSSESASARHHREGYRLVGGWVQSPLRWAVSVGLERDDLRLVSDLKAGDRVGVSRLGSGSHVMSAVLAQRLGLEGQGDREAFEPIILNNIAGLKEGVSRRDADFFMWEHYTTSSSWVEGAERRVKRIGEIETPWPSWLVVASSLETSPVGPSVEGEKAVKEVLAVLQKGVDHFREPGNREEVILMILDLKYSREDAEAWLEQTKYVPQVEVIQPDTIKKTLAVLEIAGVLRGAEVQELSSRYVPTN